jgi:putative peptidoglycan lipid II flippase
MAGKDRVSEQPVSGERQIARAARIVIVLFAVSRALGLVREMVIGASFGTGPAYDAYLAAVLVPDILFNLIAAGALGSAFIPVFADYFARGDSAGGWRMASAVITLLFLVLTVAALTAALAAQPLVGQVLAPGFSTEQQDLAVSLMRTMLVAPVFFGISGVIMGILNARQHFLLPALAPSFLNLSLIAAAWFLAPIIGIQALAWGYVAGAILHLCVQLPGLVLVKARYRPLLTFADPGVKQVLRLMAPRVLGLAVVQLSFLININLGSRLGQGSVAALNYAWRLMLLPHGIFAHALATAAFPTFAEQAAEGKIQPMRQALAATLRTLYFVTIPAAVGLLVLGRPLVSMLLERMAFQEASTQAVTWALSFYALGLVGHAGVEIVARAFYALHDTWTPVWVGGVTMGLNVTLSLLLVRIFAWAGLQAHGGLALANSIATLLEMVGLMILMRPRLEGLEGKKLVGSVVRSLVAATVMTAVLLIWQAALASSTAVTVGTGGVVIGAVAYLTMAALLRSEETSMILHLVRRTDGREDV